MLKHKYEISKYNVCCLDHLYLYCIVFSSFNLIKFPKMSGRLDLVEDLICFDSQFKSHLAKCQFNKFLIIAISDKNVRFMEQKLSTNINFLFA